MSCGAKGIGSVCSLCAQLGRPQQYPCCDGYDLVEYTSEKVVASDIALGVWQVALPSKLCYQLLALALADFMLAYWWETFLRRRFPAECPPQKGYLAYKDELRHLNGRQHQQDDVLLEDRKTR